MSKKGRQQGELESLVLDALWSAESPLTSQQILAMLGDDDLAITTVLTVLHDIGLALQADHVVVMQQGRVMHHGACADPATHTAIESVFEHRIRILALQGQWVVVPRST